MEIRCADELQGLIAEVQGMAILYYDMRKIGIHEILQVSDGIACAHYLGVGG
jgi:hypothetical protein